MIFDQHTVVDLEDLLNYYDNLIAEMQKTFDAVPIGTHDRETWLTEWESLKLRYATAAEIFARPRIRTARALCGKNVTCLALATGEDQWVQILHAVSPGRPQEVPGDIMDLFRRLNDMGGKVDESKAPQPTPNTDLDLEAFKKLDKTTKTIDATAEQTKKTVTSPFLIGGLVALGGLGLALYAGWKPFAPKKEEERIPMTEQEVKKLDWKIQERNNKWASEEKEAEYQRERAKEKV